MTNLPGCFNVGESDYQYHGANRLGANALLACIFGGLVTGVEVPKYLKTLNSSCEETSSTVFENALRSEREFKEDLFSRNGGENVHVLHDQLAKYLVDNVTVKRNNEDLRKTLEGIKEIRERYKKITLDDHGHHLNQTYIFANQFRAMLDLAMIITKGALLRDEFRGAHFKPEFPFRDDKNWLKTTIAEYGEEEPKISYEKVDIRHLDPIPRDYTTAKKVKPELKNIPQNIELPI